MSLFRIVSNTLTARDSTFDSIYIIINTQDEQERDNLTERWRDHKLEELNFIGIVVGNNPCSQTADNALPCLSIIYAQLTFGRVLCSLAA